MSGSGCEQNIAQSPTKVLERSQLFGLSFTRYKNEDGFDNKDVRSLKKLSKMDLTSVKNCQSLVILHAHASLC